MTPRSKGHRALTTTEAAALVEQDASTFRSAMTRERQRGHDYRLPRDAWPDGRTPMWDSKQLEAWHATRQRRGQADGQS